MKKAGAVVLLSGGLDSATLVHYVCRSPGFRPVRALTFDYGQKHAKELDMARRQAGLAGVAEHRVVDISFLKRLVAGSSALTDGSIGVPDLLALGPAQRRQPPTYVPNRNAILLCLAAAYAEAAGIDAVFYGAHAEDEYGYWDCTAGFVRALNRLLSLNRCRPVRIRAPFLRKGKSGILRIGLALGVDYGQTWSCYRGGARPCGRCPTCVERARAFREVGATDPLLPVSRPS